MSVVLRPTGLVPSVNWPDSRKYFVAESQAALAPPPLPTTPEAVEPVPCLFTLPPPPPPPTAMPTMTPEEASDGGRLVIVPAGKPAPRGRGD